MGRRSWGLRAAASALCVAVVAMAAVIVESAEPVAADPPPANEPWVFAQVLTDAHVGIPASRVSMSDGARSVAVGIEKRCGARQPLGEREPSRSGLAVVDKDPDPLGSGDVSWHGADWFPWSGDCQNSDFDLSADGLRLVGSMYSDISLSVQCPANPGEERIDRANYGLGQIVLWERGSVGSDFGAPKLVTRVAGDCTGPWAGADPDTPSSLEDLVGNGAYGTSGTPSMNADGSRIVFRSDARDFPVSPTDEDTDGLYVAEPDVEVDGLPKIAMVTPPGFVGTIGSSQISDDGERVVFKATGSGMGGDVAVTEEDGAQVWVAQAPSSGDIDDPWTITLVSVDESGSPLLTDENSLANGPPSISADGRFVSFATSSQLAETSGITYPEQVGDYLVIRDLDAGESRVMTGPNDASTAYVASGRWRRAAFNDDGSRVAATARHQPQGWDEDFYFLRVFDLGQVFGETPVRPALVTSTAIADDPVGLDLGGVGDNTLVGMVSGWVGGPTGRDVGGDPAVYIGGSQDMRADLLRPWHGDPVDTATGAFHQSETDLTSTAGGSLASITRAYSSIGDASGIFGDGWTSPLDVSIDLRSETGSVTLDIGADRRVTYGSDGDSWTTDSGYRGVLSHDEEPDVWTLAEPSGVVRSFDAQGRLSRVEVPGQTPATVTWAETWPPPDDGDPETLMPSVMASIEVGSVSFDLEDTTTPAWDGETPDSTEPYADGLVDRVVSSEGPVVDYGYRKANGSTTLHSVSKPHLSAQAPGSYGSRTYMYQPGTSRLTTITDAVDADRSHLVVDNSYDGLGRVSHQVTDTGDDLTFRYGVKPDPLAGFVAADGFTTVTNEASGDVTVYEYDESGAIVGVTDALGQSLSKEWTGDLPGSSTSRSGVGTDYTYDAAGRVETVVETADGVARTMSTLTYVVAETSPAALTDDRIATSTEASGVTTTYSYDGSDRWPSSTSVPCDPDSLGAGLSCPSSGLSTTTYTYFDGDLDGLVETQVDPDGVTTSFTYHDDRTLASSTIYEDDGTERTTTFETLRPGDVGWPFTDPAIASATRTETPSGAVTWEGFDAEGKVRETRDPLYDGTTHEATRTTYRLDGSVESVTNPADELTVFDVRRPGDPGWSETADIAEVRISTDADGVSSVTKVDRSGDPVVTQKGNLAALGTLATTTSTYSELGRLDHTVGPTGVRTSYHYDVEGRVTGVTVGNDPDAAVRTRSTVYDARGQVTSESTPMGTDPAGASVTRSTSFFYDAAGRKVAQLEGAGGPAASQLLTGYVYDDAGRLWRTIEHRDGYLDTANPTVINAGSKVSETRYTLAGRVAQQVGPPVDATSFDWSSPDSAKSITTFGYDDAGRQTTVTAPGSKVTTTTYDAAGRVASVESPGGKVVSYGYDAAGQRTSVVTPSGLGAGQPATVTAVTGFDAAGRKVSESDPHIPVSGVVDPSTRFWSYTPGGRVHQVIDANGNVVTYGYDARGNRTSRTAKNDAGADVVESWTYNLADQELTHTVPPPRVGATAKTTTSTYDGEFGWLATVTDPTNQVQTRSYYADGTLKSIASTKPSATSSVDAWYVNARGWTTKTTQSTGSSTYVTETGFDRAGQKVSEKSHTGQTITHGYSLAGAQVSLGYVDGTTATSTHDPQGRLATVALTSGGVTIPYASYAYDDDGNELYELLPAAGGASRASTYDAAGRLATFTEVMPAPGSTWQTYTATLTYRPDGRVGTETINSDPTVTYGYDDAGQLTSAIDGVTDRTWTYGTRGNRLTTSVAGVTTTYDTNPNGTVAKTTTGTNTVTHTYDDAARRNTSTWKTGSTVTRTWTAGFNAQGRSATIMNTGGGLPAAITEYRTYNPDGLLVYANILDDGPTSKPWKYEWDTTQGVPQIINITTSGSLKYRAAWGTKRISFRTGTATPLWFQYDAHGSVIRTDDTNTLLVDGPPTYTADGQPTQTTDYIRYGYRAELTTRDLTYLRARDLDTASGQFTSPDPFDGVDGTPTLAAAHHYADNDALSRSDPEGLRSIDDDLIYRDPCAHTHDLFTSANMGAITGNRIENAEYPGDWDSSLCYLPTGLGIVDIPGDATLDELKTCVANPNECAFVRTAQSYAKDSSERFYPGSDNDGDPRNAMKHMMWAGMMSALFGVRETALKFLDTHEIEQVNVFNRRYAQADNANNFYGIEIGLRVRQEMGTPSFNVLTAQRLADPSGFSRRARQIQASLEDRIGTFIDSGLSCQVIHPELASKDKRRNAFVNDSRCGHASA